jgi:hypothetical protein
MSIVQRNVRDWIPRTSNGSPCPFAVTRVPGEIRLNAVAIKKSGSLLRRAAGILAQNRALSGQAQFRESLGSGFQRLLGFAEREAQLFAAVSRIAIETRAWDGRDTDFLH